MTGDGSLEHREIKLQLEIACQILVLLGNAAEHERSSGFHRTSEESCSPLEVATWKRFNFALLSIVEVKVEVNQSFVF
jgi:hypothetical protein